MWGINQDCQSVRRFWLSGNFQSDGQLSLFCDDDENDYDGGGYDYDDRRQKGRIWAGIDQSWVR